jgi:hypothetical protein
MRNSEMQFAHVSFQNYMKKLQGENEMPLSVKGKWHLMILLLGDLLCE